MQLEAKAGFMTSIKSLKCGDETISNGISQPKIKLQTLNLFVGTLDDGIGFCFGCFLFICSSNLQSSNS